MRARILAVAVFAATLATMVAPAGAATIEVDPAGTALAVSYGSITFGSSPTVQCNVTLLLTLESSAALRANAEMGSLWEMSWSNCEGGEIWTAVIAPSFIDIEEISGSAPNEIEGLGLDVDQFDIEFSVFGGFINCDYRGDAGMFLELWEVETATYETGDLILDESVQLSQIEGSVFCPDEIGMAGSFSLSQQTIDAR